MLVPYNPLDYIQALSEELDSLRVSMHEIRVAAGLAEMAGQESGDQALRCSGWLHNQ